MHGTASCKCAAPFIAESWVSICWARPRPAAVNAPSSCPSSTAEILRRRKENAITQWIFPDPVRPELPLSPNCAYTHMKAILHKAGLPDIRFHDLRHTFATHAIASGVDAKTLSGILGHTNASFTLDTYTHVTPDMQKAASGIVGGFMEDLLGKGLRPWQRNGKAELAP